MRRIADLPHTDADTRRRLRKAKIKTLKQLWQAIGADFDEGLQRVAHQTGTDPEQLIDILAEGARPPAPRVKVHEAVAAACLAILLFLVLWRVGGAVKALPETFRPAPGSVRQVAVVTGLPAFHTLEARDLTLVEKPETTGAFLRIEDVAGYYLVEPLDSGMVIRKDQLSTAALPDAALTGRRILSLPLNDAALNPNVVQGAHVTLLFTPSIPGGTNPPSSVAVDAVVLRLEPRDGVTVLTVAFEEARREEIGAVLGTSDVFILQRVP